jgi:tripeptidyl-peptidase II
MPLASSAIGEFQADHPTYDGRGVLIGILDSGIDPEVNGLRVTSAGAPKVLDLRDFSGEGAVRLTAVTPGPDGTVQVGTRTLTGAGRIARITGSTTWYVGELRELPLGRRPGADLNGNGTNTDVYPVVVVRAIDGWVVFVDTNLNGSFDDETPLHDYREARETLALGTKPLSLAANLGEVHGVPVLDFVFDNSGHGTHVAGIAAGHDLFNVPGFDGVAPGAQLLGLKISNNARGGVSVTGSMERAMEYAARFAQARGLPLVLNMSFGLGNESERSAVLDSLVNAFLSAHPGIVFAISAGNDGPGLSTMDFPASADLALAAGASYPGAFARPPHSLGPTPRDVVGWWSSRGGELAKPDLVTPGIAFSSVPRFDQGDEFKGGTSMAAPFAAGLAARLFSAMRQEGRSVGAADVRQALRASAVPLADGTLLDQGPGEPQLEAAYRWLEAGHQGSTYLVRTASGRSAAFRRDGLAGPGDTLDLFRVRHVAGLRAARFLLKSSATWLSAPANVTAAPGETTIPVHYAAAAVRRPGVYLGAVTVWDANDTLAGPVFTLASTIVVPYDLAARPLVDTRRPIGPARVQRYFLRATRPGATLYASVTLPDSLAEGATARLYEPSGQPFRETDEVSLGHLDPGTARFVVRADDLVPGVYELDVFAPPLHRVTVTVQAALAPLTLAQGVDQVEVTNPDAATVRARAALTLVGAAREFVVAGDGAAPESVTVQAPEWASAAVVDVTVPAREWDEFTGFGLTEYDSTGQQFGQSPLNYAFGRQRVYLPTPLKGHAFAIELSPAFARADGAHPWHATVRVRFLLNHPRTVGRAADLAVVPGGRVMLPLSDVAPPDLPPGFAPCAELRVRPASGQGLDAVGWVTPPVRP